MNPPESPAGQKKSKSPILLGCGIAFVVFVFGAFILLGKACSMVGNKFKEVTSEMQKNPARAAALLALRFNPDVEVLNTDDARNEVTFKEKKSGKVITMSFDDVAQGKFTVRDSEGHEMVLDASKAKEDGTVRIKGPEGETVIGGAAAGAAVPAWVPSYPGATAGAGGMKGENNGVLSGMAMFETTDAAAKVQEFFQSKLKEAGYKVETTSTDAGGKNAAYVNGQKESPKSSVNAVISSEQGKTSIMVTYEGPK